MNRFDNGDGPDAHPPREALTSYRAMFDSEHEDAMAELARPAMALFFLGA